jgi:hypothetical protein
VRALGGLFALALAVILAACGGGGSKTGGNPAATQSCNVTLSQLKQHPTLATRIEQTGLVIRIVSDESRTNAEALQAAAVAAPSGSGAQSGGTNSAVDTTINNFCGVGVGSGNTASVNSPVDNSVHNPPATVAP